MKREGSADYNNNNIKGFNIIKTNFYISKPFNKKSKMNNNKRIIKKEREIEREMKRIYLF